jgi:predicted RNA-binding protein YlxR (DUF448 family)
MALPERTCCGCFQKKPKADMIAVTRLKDDSVVLNKDFKLSGRSAYLCDSLKCLGKVRDRKGKSGLEYALKVKIPQKIWAELGKVIKKP